MRSPVLRRAVRVVLLAVLGVLATAFVVPAAANAEPGDIGFKGPSWGNLGGSAPGKEQSKLWYADGIWWADMYDGLTSQHTIHRLNRATNTWTSTGTQLDPRKSTRSDTLWDASVNKLYVASHIFKESASSSATAADGNRIFRYSYNPNTDAYSLDPGFPVTIANHTAEVLTIDKDSQGRIWATWVASQKVWVTHSTAADASTWVAPFNIPGATNVTTDDISSIVAYQNKVGVLWSDEAGGQMRFAEHTDGQLDTAWTPQILNTGYSPDDHISMRADTAGNIWAATKTSESGSNPLILLSKRTPGGTWTHTPYGTGRLHTRPTLLLNEPAGEVHVLATCPEAGQSSGQNGGDICAKVTSMANPTFQDGPGTPIMHEGTVAEPDLNDVTSTKQNLTGQSGIVALAGNDTLNYYWHSDRPLGGNPPVDAKPAASFTATPTSGSAPLNVQFTNTTTAQPAVTSYLWTFGDGATSTEVSPSHVYAANGTYTVSLKATNAIGNDTRTEAGLITVADAPTGGEQAFPAVADAPVKSSSPTKNYGTDNLLRLRQDPSPSGTTYRSYLKFDVTGVSNVTGAKLRLFSTDGSPDGGRVYATSNAWTEPGITWNTKPDAGVTVLGSAGATANNAFVDIPLGTAVTGNGQYSFVLVTTSTNSQYYSSKEAATNRPQLIVTTSGGPPPPPGAVDAQFAASATSGQVQLPVTFTDQSTNGPTSWSWNFGDGGTSTEQSPTHTYTAPGTYTVSLTATRATPASSDTETKTAYITVTSAPPPGTTRTITPIADAHVKSNSATKNYGTLSTLQVRNDPSASGTNYVTFLKFDVTGASGPIANAKLRLFVTDASPDGGAIFKTGDIWTETGLTWNSKPAIPATSVATIGGTTAGQWVEIPLVNVITGNGIYSFAIKSASTNSAIYTSREGTNKPQLVLPA